MKKLLVITCISLVCYLNDVHAQDGGSGIKFFTTIAPVVTLVVIVVITVATILSEFFHKKRNRKRKEKEQAFHLEEIPINLTL